MLNSRNRFHKKERPVDQQNSIYLLAVKHAALCVRMKQQRAAGVNKVSGSQAVEQLLHQPLDGRQVAHRGPSQSVQCCRHSDLGQPIVSISTANVQVSYSIYILLVKWCCPGTFVTGLSYDRTRCTYRFNKRIEIPIETGSIRFLYWF